MGRVPPWKLDKIQKFAAHVSNISEKFTATWPWMLAIAARLGMWPVSMHGIHSVYITYSARIHNARARVAKFNFRLVVLCRN